MKDKINTFCQKVFNEKTKRMMKQISLNKYFICLYMIGSFFILDFGLRLFTSPEVSQLDKVLPMIYTLMYSLIFSSIVILIPFKKIKTWVYGILYYLCFIIMVVQYGAQLILHKFLFINDLTLASEGADYADYVIDMIDLKLIILIIFFVAIGVLGIKLIKKLDKIILPLPLASIVLAISVIFYLPTTFGEMPSLDDFDFATNKAYLYQEFEDSNSALQVFGLYQFSARDIHLTIKDTYFKEEVNYDEAYARIDAFFEKRFPHHESEYTGIFEGKNLIVVMMESVDDFLITKEDTPTLYKMKNEGINFTNFYTPDYSVGYTFNTEFAFNTSTYPYRSGNVAFEVGGNHFNQAIASKFSDANYRCRSYHFNDANYYNRGLIHQLFGYEKYVCYQEYQKDAVVFKFMDQYLTTTQPLFEDFINGDPFYSFNITYSAHLPYKADDEFSKYILERYPQYDKGENTSTVDMLRAKVKLTDDMFADLLKQLEDEGILDDTVIVAFADHYAYGLEDDELKQFLEPNELFEKTPFFIYNSELEHGVEIDKVGQTIDILPTILNMFNIECDKVMGQDLMDPYYVGYAFFPDSSFRCKDTYYQKGKVKWGNELEQEMIWHLVKTIREHIEINDLILESDYYNR